MEALPHWYPYQTPTPAAPTTATTDIDDDEDDLHDFDTVPATGSDNTPLPSNTTQAHTASKSTGHASKPATPAPSHSKSAPSKQAVNSFLQELSIQDHDAEVTDP